MEKARKGGIKQRIEILIYKNTGIMVYNIILYYIITWGSYSLVIGFYLSRAIEGKFPMKVMGLIVEYNPFHNGHLHHLEESKICGADYTVCVMSGNFIQRGEPAIVNKWARVNMALSSGVDLIIELPFPYAMSSAEYFASGSVKILNDIGIVDFLCFGSEHGNIGGLDFIALLIDEPKLIKLFKARTGQGISILQPMKQL